MRSSSENRQFGDVGNSQAISVLIVDINPPIVKTIVGDGYTSGNNVTYGVETLNLIPLSHELQLLEVFHRLELVCASENQLFTFLIIKVILRWDFTFQKWELGPQSLEKCKQKPAETLLAPSHNASI